MSKPTILISIDTNTDTTTEGFGRSFIQSLCEEDTRLIPEKLSTCENYKDPFLGIEDFLTNWWAIPEEMRVDGQWAGEAIQGPSWKRKSTLANRGMVEHGFVNRKNHKISSALWFESRWAKEVDFDHLFNAWVQLSRPETAMLHLFAEPELNLQDHAANMSFRAGSFGKGTTPGLPNMGWAMAYGGDYAAEVNAALIKTAGFFVEVQDGLTIVRVTEKLSDVVEDFPYFSQRRAELKGLFRPGLFWIEDEPIAA